MDISWKKILNVHLNNKFIINIFPVLFFLCLSTLIFIGIILTPGTIGFHHDWPYGPFPEMIEELGSEGFDLFSESQGNKIYPTDWLFRIALVPFAGLGGEVLTKSMLVLFTALSGTAMFWLARELKLDYRWALVAGIIYVFTPIVFTRAIAGHMYYLLAYAIAPLAFMLFMRATRSERPWKYALLSGALIGIATVQIQFSVMLPLLLVGYLIFDYKHTRTNLPVFTIVVLVALLIQLPWVLPLMTDSTITEGLPVSSYINYHDITSAPSLWESFGMLGYKIQPYSYTSLASSGLIPSFLPYLSVSFLGVALLSLIFRRDSLTLSLSTIALIGVFLGKGMNEPGGEIFEFLFLNTPLIIFRELWHLVFLVVFPATVLVAIFIQDFSKYVKRRSGGRPWAHIAAPLAVALLVIIPAGCPLMLGGNFGGYLQTYTLSDDYDALFDELSEANGTTRILWVPSMGPMRYSDLGRAGVDPLISSSPLPSFPSSPYANPSPLSGATMFFIVTMQENDTAQFGNVLSPFGIAEIVVRTDFQSKYPWYSALENYPDLAAKWESQAFARYVQGQDDLLAVTVSPEFTRYQNQVPSSMVSAPSTVVLGSKDLSALSHLASVTHLGEVAYLTDKGTLGHADLLFAMDDTRDIISLTSGQSIDPASAVPGFDDKSDPHREWIPAKGWSWYDPLFSTSTNTGIFTLGDSTVSMPVSGDGSEVWAKVMFWEDGAVLEFDMGSSSTTVRTDSSTHMPQWVKIGEVDGSSQLTIASSSGRGYVDEILVVNKAELASLGAAIGDRTVVYLLTSDGYDVSGALPRSEPHAVDIEVNDTMSRWIDIYEESAYSLTLDVEGHVMVSVDGAPVDMGWEGSQGHGAVFLDEGRHELRITALADSAVGDLWMISNGLSPEETFSPSKSAVIEQYQKNDPQSWQVKVNATEPFFLMLSEPYDPRYVAIVNGQEIGPVQAYSFMNGYWIDQTGELTIDLAYKPQKQFEIGLVIACLTIGACVGFAVWDTWRGRRKCSGKHSKGRARP